MTVFNAVCFAVLMDHHKDGVELAHPNYVREKLDIFENCSKDTAYSLLDAKNQARVRQWCSDWDYDYLSTF